MDTIVHDGWLTKSPPDNSVFKSRWRERWFVLKQSGQIPGQYVLEYFTDESCKKSKGVIDLDQCEQVDAGLSINLTSPKANKYVFDIKTNKRVFYFASKTVEDMNKWVDCICTVCGLKIHDEEQPNDYRLTRYSPQPSADTMPVNAQPTTLLDNIAASTRALNNNGPRDVPQASAAAALTTASLPRPRLANSNTSPPKAVKPAANTNHDNRHQLEPSSSCSESASAYLLISECHTGKPVSDRMPLAENKPIASLSKSPGKSVPRVITDDSYDVPRTFKLPTAKSRDQVSCLLNKVPSAPKHFDKPINGRLPGVVKNPPQVNWSTYPSKDGQDAGTGFSTDSMSRASVRSCNASFESKQAKQPRIRTESGPATNDRRCSTPNGHGANDNYLNTSQMSISETSTGSATLPLRPPPRPPKPPSLRRSKSRSDSCSSLPNELSDEAYDIVPPPTSIYEQNSNGDRGHHTGSASNSPHKAPPRISPPSVTIGHGPSPDDLYDFPRPSTELSADLNSFVPLPSQATLTRSKAQPGHCYSNAPKGFFATKESVFQYDYTPSLPTSNDDTNFEDQPERSPRTPNSANLIFNCNLPPPVVNRDLKPRRKNSDSDATASPTTPIAFHLSPPPAVSRGQNSIAHKAIKKLSPVNANPAPLPRAPYRGKNGFHSRDASFEDDGLVMKRTPMDDHHLKMSPKKIVNLPEATDEIQYLDLDLDSDNSSPRTPNQDSFGHSKANSSMSVSNHSNTNSVVYKTLDFVKTKALEELNIETIRKQP